MWYTTSTADVRPSATPEDLEREARLSLVSLRVLLVLRAAEARGERLRSRRQVAISYKRVTGRSTSDDKIAKALADLTAAGLVVGLVPTGKSS